MLLRAGVVAVALFAAALPNSTVAKKVLDPAGDGANCKYHVCLA